VLFDSSVLGVDRKGGPMTGCVQFLFVAGLCFVGSVVCVRP